MSEEIQVKTVKNNGAESRWGLGSFLYKTDGKKRSLNTKLMIFLVSIFVLLSTTYSLISAFFNPNQIGNETIGIKTISSAQSENSELVQLDSKNLTSKRKISTGKYFPGAQIINRQNKIQIPGGILVKAQILSQSPQGFIRAVLSEPVVVQGEEIISSGSTVSGSSQSNEDRLQIRFNKMLDKNGKAYPIEALACDESDQALGVKGKKSTRAAWLLATTTGLSVLSQAAQGVGNSTNPQDTLGEQLKKRAISESSKTTLEQSQNYLSDFKNQKTMIQVDSGTVIYILFEGE
jgi:hypothetical protein